MNHKIWRFDNADSLYYALIDSLAATVTKITATGKNPVIALPTGNTMIPFYRLIIENSKRLQTEKWICFNLDEYFPIHDSNQNQSFDAFMELHFYSKLPLPVFQRKILNGKTLNPEQECIQYEADIQAQGGIDLCLLGLGMNGHIAFNEPKSDPRSQTRKVELHPETLMANFRGEAIFTHALTLGIGTIRDAREIFIIALGKGKAHAVKAATQEPISILCPASHLQNHPQVTWFIDQDAADLI